MLSPTVRRLASWLIRLLVVAAILVVYGVTRPDTPLAVPAHAKPFLSGHDQLLSGRMAWPIAKPHKKRPQTHVEAQSVSYERPVTHVTGTSIWDRIAACESGGNWSHSGGTFEGGLQFLHSTWVAAGGRRYAEHAYQATREQQIAIAQAWLERTSWAQWPACSRRLGLR